MRLQVVEACVVGGFCRSSAVATPSTTTLVVGIVGYGRVVVGVVAAVVQ